MDKGLKRVVGVIMVVALFGTANTYADKDDDTLVVAFSRELTNLDYNYGTKTEYIILGDLIDDSLFYVDPESLEYVPSLATGFEIIDDLTVQVDLRTDAVFHSGAKMSADDVIYTYNFILQDDENSRHAKIADWLNGVDKIDEHSVQFNLKEPYANLFNDMYRIRIRKNGIMGEEGNYDSNAQSNAVDGLGPYKVVSFDPGVEVLLERHEAYFAGPKGRPAIKNMLIRSIPDTGTQQAELMSGGVHWVYNVKKDVGEAMARSGRVDYQLGESLRIGFLILDAAGYSGDGHPLTDVRVRRAMNHAINRESIASNLIGGPAKAIHTACNPLVFGCFQDVVRYDYNPETAKALLADAGFSGGFELDIWSYRDKEAAQALAADLGKVGIRVNLRHGKLAGLNKARASREIRAYFGTWGSTASPDTATIANIHWRDPESGDRNLSGDPKVGELMIGGERTLDVAERQRLYAQGLSLIADEAYWVPLWTYSEGVLSSTEIVYKQDPDGYPRLWNISWKE